MEVTGDSWKTRVTVDSEAALTLPWTKRLAPKFIPSSNMDIRKVYWRKFI